MAKHRKNKRGYVQSVRGVSPSGIWGGWYFNRRLGRVCYLGARKPDGQPTIKKQCRTAINRKVRHKTKQMLKQEDFDLLPTKYDFDNIGWLD